MCVRRVIQQRIEAAALLGQAGEQGLDSSVQLEVDESALRSVPRRALDVGLTEQDSLLLEPVPTLLDNGRMADVVRRLDVVAKRRLNLGDRLSDRGRIGRHCASSVT